MKSTGNLSLRKFCLLLLMLVSYTDTYVLAAPRGGHVVSGTATFQENGPLTVVTAGNHSIINYGSFDIAAGETVRFVQPGANSSVLNRVVGSANPTEIFGSLQANGHVFIVNPYGIFFRNGSVISVGSLYAGAGNLSDADFAKGKVHFTDLAGDVRNDGIIVADNHIALMGANVVNTGSLNAAHGLAMMVSGKDVYVGEKNGNVFVHANGGAATAGAAASGSIVNHGTVAAPRVLIGGGDLYSTAITNSGLIQGRSVVVNAGPNGTATVGGKLDATSEANRTADGKGGSIQVLGGTVALHGAALDASGVNGGGRVRIGGDLHGGGTLAHAATTTVDAASTIKADATGANGDGGTVVVWSDQATVFNGQSSARGGSASGNGGSTEVSSHGALAYGGLTDLRAPAGQTGNLLLDPHTVTIADGTSAVPSGGTTFALLTPDQDVTILTGALSRQLDLAATTLQANTDIHFTGGTVTGTVAANGLTLQAGRSIILDANVQLNLAGSLTATFNDQTALAQYRDQGAAVFSMSTGSKITAPGGVTIQGGSLAQYAGPPAAGDPLMLPTTVDTTVTANTGAVTITDISTASATAGTASGNLSITQNALATGQGITVSGTLTTTPTATDTAGGNVTVTSTGTTSVAGILAAGSGTGLGGTVRLQGVAPSGGTAISLNGAITGNGLLDTGLTTIATGGTVTTANAQQYSGGLALATPVTLTGGPITADSLVGNTNDLTVNSSSYLSFGTITSGGNLIFNAAGVGVGSALTGPVTATSLTTSGGRFNLTGGSITTSSATTGQNYGGAVRLGVDTTLMDTLKGPISLQTVDGLITGAGTGFALKVDTGGTTTFNGAVGAQFPLGGLTVTGAANLTGGTVTTNGATGQLYQNKVTLSPTGGATVLTAGTGPIDFTSTIEGSADKTQALTLSTSGPQTFGGTVGATNALTGLATGTGEVDLNGGTVNTSGAQTYNGNVILALTGGTVALPVTTTLTGGTGVTFNGKVDGNTAGFQALVVNSPASETFKQPVGGTQPLASLTTDSGGSLGGNTVLSAAGTAATPSVQTTGAQSYNDPVLLGANTVLAAGSLALGSTIDGTKTATTGYDLTLTIGSAITLNGSTGGAGATGTLRNIGNFVSNGTGLAATTTFNGDFETYGLQTFATPVFLSGNRTFHSDGGGAITFAAVDSSTNTGYSGLTVNTGGVTTFGGLVGSTNPLGSVTTDSGGSTVFNAGGGGVTVQTDNDGTATGAQTYNDNVTVQQATTLQSSAVGAGTTGGAIAFGTTVAPRTVDGPGALTLNTTGATSFTGTVGATPLASLTIGAGGTGTTVNAASITTVGTQTYNSPLKLASNLTLNTSSTSTDATVGAITFGSTVGNSGGTPYSLTTATAGGNTVFGPGSNSVVGSLLSALTTSAKGSTIFNNASFETNGTQTYQGDVVVQSSTRALALTADTGNVAFNGQVSSTKAASSDLTVNAKGAASSSVTFGKAVGGDATASNDAALNRLVVNSPTINVNGGVVNTSSSNPRGTANDGLQTYNGQVVLGANTTFVGSSAAFNGGLTSDVKGPYNLTLNLANQITLPGTTSLTNINDFASVGAGGVLINNNVTTKGSQTYSNGTVTIAGPSLITLQAGTGNAASGITLNSAVNDQSAGTHGLKLLAGTSGTVTINAPIGAGTNGALANLTAGVLTTTNPDNTTTTINEPVTINGVGVTTTGTQNYGNLTLGASAGGSTLTTLSSTGTGGRVAAASVTGGGNSLTVSAPGTASTSEFGKISKAGTLQFNVTGVANFDDTITATSLNLGTGSYAALGGGSITTTAGQTYGEAVRLFKDATLADTTGDITLANVDSSSAAVSYALTVNTGGKTLFGGTVGFTFPLASVTTDAVGSTQINNASIRTNGLNGQQYNDAVTLGATTTLFAGTAPVFFGLTLGSATVPRGLTISTSGLTTFTGQVGGAPGAAGSAVTTVPALASLTTTNGGEVDIKTGVTTVTTTGGAQNYGGLVKLTGDATLKGDTLSLSKSGLSGQTGQFSLTLDFADTQVAVPGAIIGLNNFASVGRGGTLINGLFSTKGTQLYGNAVTLSGTPNLQAAGSVTFASTVDGNALLTLNVTGTNSLAVFNGLVGDGTALNGLNVTTTGGTQFKLDAGSSQVSHGGVNVGAGGLTILGPVLFAVTNGTLADATHPTVVSTGGQTYNGAATLGADTGLVDTGNVTFKSTVDGAFALAAATGGSEFFNGAVGGTTALTGLTTDAPGVLATPGGQAQFDFTLNPTTQAGVRVNGNVSINDASVFHIDSSKAVAGVVTQPGVLTLNNGTQTYGGTVTLTDETSFVSTAGAPALGAAFTDGGQINFQSLVTSAGGAQNLYVRTGSGPTQLLGTVAARLLDLGGALVQFAGNVGPVNVFSVEPNGGGTGGSITLGTGVTTAGAQTYNTGLILGASTVLTSQNTAGDGGNITFTGTVNSDATARALTVNTSGLTIFSDLVGNSSPLLSLTTDNEGKVGEQTRFNMKLTAPGTVAGVQVEGAVTINDPVLFGAAGSTLTVPTILTGVLGGTGSQTYAAAATLGQNTVLTDVAAGNLKFGGTVDGTFDLSLNTAGDEFFGGLVGQTNPLASLETDQVGTPKGTAHFTMDLSPASTLAGVRVNGAVNLADGVEFAATNNGGTIPTVLSGGAQTYASVLTGQTYTLGTTVTRDTILASKANGQILFATTVDGPAALTLNTGGVTQFDGAVGGTTALGSLTTDAPGTTQLNGGSVATTNGQTYDDPVLLGANTSLSSPATGTVFFNSTVNGAFTLAVNTAGLTTFKGTVGNETPLVSLTTLGSGAVEIDGSLVATTGAQDFGGDVTLGAPTVFTSSNTTGTGNITFESGLDGPFALTVNTGGVTRFNGPVGSSGPLASLTTDQGGTTEIAGGALTTTGAQTYNDAVALGNGAVLNSTNLGNIFFQSRLDGAFALTVNTGGVTRFNGLVGVTTPLASLTTDAPGSTELNAGQIITVGSQVYGDAVRLIQGTVLTSNNAGNLRFGQTLDGAFTLNLNTAGITRFDGAVGGNAPLASLTTDAPGSTRISGGSIMTVGAQTYLDPATLGADTLLASAGGNVLFAAALDSDAAASPRNLTVNTAGRTEFDQPVGGLAALGSVTTDAGGVTVIKGGGVTTVRNGTTTGAQTYNDALRLGADATLASLVAGTATAGGNLTFNSTVDGAFALTLNTGGLTQFNQVVGNTTALTGLTTDNAGAVGEGTQFNLTIGTALAGVLVNGPVQINDAVLLNIGGGSLAQPGVLTLGNHGQAYNGPVALGTSTYLTSAAALPAPGAGFTGGGGIRFNSPTGISSVGGSDLSVRSAVGTTLLASTVNVGSLDLGGAQATFNGPVNLPGTLSVLPNDGGTAGSIEFAGSGLTTAGAQTYRVGIILGANTVLTSLNTLNDGGNLTFSGTVDSDSTATARALTLNTSGDEIFNGLVGSRGALASLTTDAPGPVGGTARFNMDLSGAPAGTAGVNVLGALTINDVARFNVAGSSLPDGTHPTILTGGAQIYNGAAVLAQDTSLVSGGGGNLVFNASLDGASGLALSSAGNEIFNGLVGRRTPLSSLATDVTGPVSGQARFNMDPAGTGPGANVTGAVTINDGVEFNAANVALDGSPGGTVLSGGTQTYGGAAVLAQNTALTSSAGNLVFKGTLDGAFGLATNGGSVHEFDGLIGSVAPLTSLVTNGGGTQFNASLIGSGAAAGVRLNGPLTVNGTVSFNVAGSSVAQPTVLTLGAAGQTYQGAATLARNTVLRSGDHLIFASTVDGAFTLTLDAMGVTTLSAAIGATTPLASLTTTATGSTLMGAGTVLTLGTQTYGNLLNLARTTLLTSSGKGDLTFGSAVNGAFALTVNSQGNEVFNGPVGNVTPLLTLTTDANGGSVGGTTTFNFAAGPGTPASVLTTGAQNYNDGMTLHAATVLTGGDLVQAQSVTGNGSDLTVNAAAATFGRIGNAGNLLFAVRGVTTFNDSIVGSTVAVQGGTLVNLNAGTVTTTAGGQTYAEPVTLLRETTLNTPLADSPQNLVNVSSLNGAGFKLTLNAGQGTFGVITRGGDLVWTVAGTTTFNGTVDAASLSLNPTANDASPNPAAVALDGGSVHTGGNQTFGGKITLGADSRLTADAGTIKVDSVAGKGKALTVSAGRTVFNQIANVGALDFVASRSTAVFNGAVTADSLRVAGDAQLNGGTVTTDGKDGQNYAKGVTLGVATRLQGDQGGIDVAGKLTGNGQDLNVVAPTAAFNQIDGTGATTLQVAGVTTFNGTVRADSLLVNGGKRLDIMTNAVLTTNGQEYDQPVNLAVPDGPAVTLTSSSRDVTFGGTVNGARDLTVSTVGGTAFFRGAVGGAANGALSSLTVNDAAEITGGLVNTTGQQTYHGAVAIGTSDAAGSSLTSASANLIFDQAVRGTGGDLNVRGVNVLMHDSANVADGNLHLSATGSDTSLLQLDGTSYSSTGIVTFNDYTNLRTADLQKYSTIVLTSPTPVTVTGSGFRMGYEQKLLAAGSLNINVGRGGTATVGDLAARQNLRITAGTVDLLNRPTFTGSSLGVDSGLNFVAKTTIDFGGARIEFLNPENQTANFVTTNGSVTILRRTGLSIFRDPQVDTQFAKGFPVAYSPGEGRFVSAFLLPTGLPEQPVGGGSQTLDTAAAISGALPDQKPLDIPVDVTITASQMEELRKLGIHPRKAQGRERGSLTSREALFAQLVDGQDADNYGRLQPIKGGVSRLVPSDYVVVVDRMTEREVQAILQAFEQLYGKNKEKAPEIGGAYQKAFDEYSVAKQTADPAGFSPYLKDSPGKYPDVDKAGRGFDNLFGYIEHMGLTAVEVTKAESYIVSDLNVSGPTPEDMVKVINEQRKNLPPAQKAASTKAPPAPPVSSPAPAAPTPAPKKADPLKTVRQGGREKRGNAARQPAPVPSSDGGPHLADR